MGFPSAQATEQESGVHVEAFKVPSPTPRYRYKNRSKQCGYDGKGSCCIQSQLAQCLHISQQGNCRTASQQQAARGLACAYQPRQLFCVGCLHLFLLLALLDAPRLAACTHAMALNSRCAGSATECRKHS